jgi:hypothetical protein
MADNFFFLFSRLSLLIVKAILINIHLIYKVNLLK